MNRTSSIERRGSRAVGAPLGAAALAFLLMLAVAAPACAAQPPIRIDSAAATYRGKQTSCGGKYRATRKLGKAFLHIWNGECWSCPRGYSRTADPNVAGGNACVRTVHQQSAATRHGRATGLLHTDCPKWRPRGQGHQFWHAGDGYCYSCPAGFGRTVAGIHARNACVRDRTYHAAGVRRGVAGCPPGAFPDGLTGRCYSCPRGFDRTAIPSFGRPLDRMGDACARLTLHLPPINIKPPGDLINRTKRLIGPYAEIIEAAMAAIPRAQSAILRHGVKPERYRDRELAAAVERFNRGARRRGDLGLPPVQYASLGGAPPQIARRATGAIRNISWGVVADASGTPWPAPIALGGNGSVEFVFAVPNLRYDGVSVSISGTVGPAAPGVSGDLEILTGLYFVDLSQLAGFTWSVEFGYHRERTRRGKKFVPRKSGPPVKVPYQPRRLVRKPGDYVDADIAQFPGGADVQFVWTFPSPGHPVRLAGIIVGTGIGLKSGGAEFDVGPNFTVFFRRCTAPNTFADATVTSRGPTGCFACPRGYYRTLEHIRSNSACAKGIFGPFRRALDR